jgi:hypothetical protein
MTLTLKIHKGFALWRDKEAGTARIEDCRIKTRPTAQELIDNLNQGGNKNEL